jgi:hypothetical protein
MIDHDQARELAAAALDFDLSTEDDQRLLAHMVDCADCRTFAEALDADRGALAGLATFDAPDDLRTRILDATPAAADDAATLADTAEPPTIRPRRTLLAFPIIPRRYRWPLVGTTAAVVTVALIGGGLVWRPSLNGPVAIGSPSATAPAGSGTAPSNAPLPSIDPGSRLAASPWTPTADLTADDVSGGVVGLASGFRLTTLDGTPAVDADWRWRLFAG